MPVSKRSYLWQMRDTQYLSYLGNNGDLFGHFLCGNAADACIDLVKTIVGTPLAFRSTVLIASATRDSSPPEATFNKGLIGSPRLAVNRKANSSLPVLVRVS